MVFLFKCLVIIVCDLLLNVKFEDLRIKEWNKERFYEILV